MEKGTRVAFCIVRAFGTFGRSECAIDDTVFTL
jgi:hypothetical protein